MINTHMYTYIHHTQQPYTSHACAPHHAHTSHAHTPHHAHTTHTHTTPCTHINQWSGRQPPPCIDAPPSMPLLKHIMNQAYSRAVTNPEELNSYEPFSPEVCVCVCVCVRACVRACVCMCVPLNSMKRISLLERKSEIQ